MSMLFMLWLLFGPALVSDGATELPYSEFIAMVEQGHVETVTIDASGQASGALDDGAAYTTTLLPQQVGNGDLVEQLRQQGVEVTALAATPGLLDVLISFLPLLAILGLMWWFGRRATGQLTGITGIGRSRTKITDTERPSTRFRDVAGYDGVKREVAEIIEYLRQPDRFRRAGAVGPRGVLLVGPPGTGKTLLARALAGEADVPFLSVTGSAFVEMFVGVGAARVRDLFAEARKRAPAIIFIDEIDAIGQRRGGGMVSNDEREQTLNQLLSEMDGFEAADGIVVVAATNRPDVLDAALLRPGRFDRQVVVPLPTQAERRAILTVHCRDKRLGDDVDLDRVARATPGFSGADLANLVNEAAIYAVRGGREVLNEKDLDDARDRILLGRREESNVLLPEEKYAVAVHESGHALVAALSQHADPVAKVTILPAGMTLGVTEQLPVDERHLYSESYMRDALAVRLGGRAAELVVFGEGSTGAANDLASATDLATKMVREYGLSRELGPVGYPVRSPIFLGGQEMSSRSYAEQTQRAIDLEVARLVREAEQSTVSLLHAHRGALDHLAALLVERETIDGQDVLDVLAATSPARLPDAAVTAS